MANLSHKLLHLLSNSSFGWLIAYLYVIFLMYAIAFLVNMSDDHWFLLLLIFNTLWPKLVFHLPEVIFKKLLPYLLRIQFINNFFKKLLLLLIKCLHQLGIPLLDLQFVVLNWLLSFKCIECNLELLVYNIGAWGTNEKNGIKWG